MISQTKAYEAHKRQTLELIDFAVLVCYAVPELKKSIRAIQKGAPITLARCDYFGGNHSHEQLRSYAQRYKADLSIHLVLSSFALFDGYFSEVCAEVLRFHGGAKHIADDIRSRFVAQTKSLSKEHQADFAKLRDYPKKGKKLKYTGHIDRIRNRGHFLPSAMFARQGVLSLSNLVTDKSPKASSIPTLMEDCFLFDLAGRAANYHRIRELRNELAHSKRKTYALKDALEDSKFLRNLVRDFDAHLVRHFLVIELP